jgi:hypothetical protein
VAALVPGFVHPKARRMRVVPRVFTQGLIRRVSGSGVPASDAKSLKTFFRFSDKFAQK